MSDKGTNKEESVGWGGGGDREGRKMVLRNVKGGGGESKIK